MNDEAKAPTAPSDGISAAIEKLMEHPELISMVASAISDKSTDSTAAPETETVKGDGAATVGVNAELLGAIAPVISKLSALGSSGKGSALDSRHEQLLRALKPYVSQSRGEAIDYIIKLSSMSGLLRELR